MKLPILLTALGLIAAVLAPSPYALADEDGEPAERPTLAPSWRDQGEAAFGEKNYAEAIFLYRKWLEADPRDQTTWYNLACTYALTGQKDAALTAFERAVDAGWSDAQWPQEDADLAPLREEERFTAALARASESGSEDEPEGFERHFVEIPAIGTYVAMLPPDYDAEDTKRYPLVVILHGNGSSETKHGRLADRLGREDVIYVAPRAPYPNLGVFFGMREAGWTWRPQDADEGALESLGPERLYVDSILAAVDDATKRYRVAGDRFFVLGHSMGGFFANVTAILEPTRVAAYFAYAGGLPERFHDAKWLTPLKTNGVKAYLCHGSDDPVVPPEFSRVAYEKMSDLEIDVTHAVVTGQDHGIGPRVAESMTRWLNDVVRKEGPR